MKKILLASVVCLLLLCGCSKGDSSSQSKVAKEGDVVKIDFVGKLDGVAFEGGTASGQIVELGAGQFVPGFEEGIKRLVHFFQIFFVDVSECINPVSAPGHFCM